MPSNNELLSLAERVEKGSGSDVALDTEILKALGWRRNSNKSGQGLWTKPDGTYADLALLTSSLDAVVALIEERLPDSLWINGNTNRARPFQAQVTSPGEYKDWCSADSNSPARALLAATLRALAAQEPTP